MKWINCWWFQPTATKRWKITLWIWCPSLNRVTLGAARTTRLLMAKFTGWRKIRFTSRQNMQFGYFSFESRCSHVLLKDAIDNTFSILIRNHPDCFLGVDPGKCHKVIKVFVQGKEYFLKRSGNCLSDLCAIIIKVLINLLVKFGLEQGVPIFASTKKILPIPGHLPGLRVNIAGNFVVLSMDSLGLVLKWDGKQLLHVEVKIYLSVLILYF